MMAPTSPSGMPTELTLSGGLLAPLNDDPLFRAAAELLRRHEAVRAYVYDDATGRNIVPGTKVLGHPTIAVGRALDLRGLSQLEQDVLLMNDINFANDYLSHTLGADWDVLDLPRRVALIDMAHNLGYGFEEFKDLLAAVRAKDWPRARNAMLASRWARQVFKRADDDSRIILTGSLG